MFHFQRATIGADELAERDTAPRAREPALVLAGVSLLVVSAAICVGLLVPALWTIATQGAQPILTYDRCGAVPDASRRLACYDDVLRRTRPGAIKSGVSPGR